MKKNSISLVCLAVLMGWISYIGYSTYVAFAGNGNFAELSYFILCKEAFEWLDVPGKWQVPLMYLGKIVPIILAAALIAKGTILNERSEQ